MKKFKYEIGKHYHSTGEMVAEAMALMEQNNYVKAYACLYRYMADIGMQDALDVAIDRAYSEGYMKEVTEDETKS